jgi:hypothetical protein
VPYWIRFWPPGNHQCSLAFGKKMAFGSYELLAEDNVDAK